MGPSRLAAGALLLLAGLGGEGRAQALPPIVQLVPAELLSPDPDPPPPSLPAPPPAPAPQPKAQAPAPGPVAPRPIAPIAAAPSPAAPSPAARSPAAPGPPAPSPPAPAFPTPKAFAAAPPKALATAPRTAPLLIRAQLVQPLAPPPSPTPPPTAPPPPDAPPPTVLLPPSQPAPPPGSDEAASDNTPAKPPEPRPRRAVAVIQALDKVTAETLRFEAPVNQPVRYKDLVFTVHACEDQGPSGGQRGAAAHLEIDSQPRPSPGHEAPPSRELFKGWMFAGAPGLHPFEHPVYDAWLIACKAA